MKRLIDRNYLWFSLLTTCLASCLLVFWPEKLGGNTVSRELQQLNRGAVYSALASIFGSLFGFVLTAVSVVLTFSDSGKLALVRESRHYPTLWKSFTHTIRVLGLATVVVLSALVLDRDAKPHLWLTYSVLGVCLLSTLMLARSVWALERVVSIVATQTERVG